MKPKDTDLDRRLSPHFTLGEMLRTSHRRIDNNATPEIIERLTLLCVGFLEPVRDRFGPLWVTSGYRCPRLNEAIGGSKTSAHMHGCAADFVPMMDFRTEDLVRWIVGQKGIDFDQVIDEYSSTSNWIHLGMVRPVGPPAPRRQALTMRHGSYEPFRAEDDATLPA